MHFKAFSPLPILLLSGCALLKGTPPYHPPDAEAAAKQSKLAETFVEPVELRWDHSATEITSQCKSALSMAQTKLDQIAAVPAPTRNFENTVLALENALGEMSDITSILSFYGSVSKDAQIREASSDCEGQVSEFWAGITTRKDLYAAIKDVQPSVSITDPRYALDARLIFETKKEFERNGLSLSDEKLTEIRGIKQKLARLETDFSKNLGENKSSLTFSPAELIGVPARVLAQLATTSDGRYVVTTKKTDYEQVMDTANLSETRKKLHFAYENRAANTNTPLLTEAVKLRRRVAHLMGYHSWADYRISDKMAKSTETVNLFLGDLVQKLAEKNKSDLALLLEIKKSVEPFSTELNAWDIRYFSYQLKKKQYQIDADKVREYFPADPTVRGMFEVYSSLFGVSFEEISNAPVWAEGVKKYRVLDKKLGKTIAFFYTDFYPRDGKYGHAAAFPLLHGHETAQGYAMPVSAIVSNFTPPSDGKPSLLSHSEVTTLFHEFGHILHQVLTRARYASMAGTNVARDLVEAPSQMLENWVWDETILSRVSGHYLNTALKLPQEMRTQLLASEKLNQGVFYTRQLILGTFDMALHTSDQEDLNVNALYAEIHKKLMGFAPIEGSSFPASFGHLMGGYEAGYYGYLWSKVYSADMFSVFEKNGLLDEKTGMLYRHTLLEKGSTVEPFDLLEKFLGRKPSNEAFLKQLGIGLK